MKYNRYCNILREDLEELAQIVNSLVSKGCTPLGGLTVIQAGQKVFYNQTVVVEDENNNTLGVYVPGESFLKDVMQLIKEGKKLQAVKLYSDKTGISLSEAKDWVDSNC